MALTLPIGIQLVIFLLPLMMLAPGLLGWLVGVPPRMVFAIGRGAAAGVLLVSVVAAIGVFSTQSAWVSPTLTIGGLAFSARLDALSVSLLLLVAFLGLVLIQFSRNYLDGDPRQGIFLSGLYLTLGTVMVFVLAGTVWQLLLGWVLTSLALHQLLVFYADRPRAVRAAQKKFIVARLGDVCFLIAAILLVQAFGTADLRDMATAARTAASGTVSAGAGTAAILVVLAAALKSAMFPVHGWLLEVMETPTPVSALLHAGLLNAGTYLVVRLGDVVFLSTPAVVLLILIGGFTALFASAAMITQTSVKVSLAYSSAAHMGFMLMLCGFGAHSVAIMHLVAHSCYKAHAFLSSGSYVDYVQNTGSQKVNNAPGPLNVLVNFGIAFSLFVVVGTALGIDLTKRPGETALGAIFVMAVTHLLIKGSVGMAPWWVMARTALSAVGVTLAFFALELTAAYLLGDVVAAFPTPNAAIVVTMWSAVVAFAVVTLLGSLLPAYMHTRVGRAVYVHLKYGFYANAWFDRFLASSSRGTP